MTTCRKQGNDFFYCLLNIYFKWKALINILNYSFGFFYYVIKLFEPIKSAQDPLLDTSI